MTIVRPVFLSVGGCERRCVGHRRVVAGGAEMTAVMPFFSTVRGPGFRSMVSRRGSMEGAA